MTRDADEDLRELEHLLGNGKARYRALQYRGDLPEPRPLARRRVPVLRYAVAASVALAATLAVLGLLSPDAPSDRDRPSRLAMPKSVATSPSFPPHLRQGIHLSLDRSRLPSKTRLPRRPSRAEG